MDEPRLRSLRELTEATLPFTVEDRRRSWAAVLSTGALTLLAVFVAALPFPLLLRVPASLFAALLFVRMFVIYHDFEHGAILRDSAAAKAILSFFGLFILSAPSIWNRLHNYHHSHNCQFVTSGVGSFPVMSVPDYRAASPGIRLRYRLIRSPFMMVFAYLGIFLLGFCGKSLRDEPRRHRDSAAAILLHLGIVAVYAQFGWTTLLLGLMLPLTCAHAIGSYLFYAQHNFPEVRLHPREEWDYVYAAVYSSSFMDGNAFMHWFTGNIGYHNVHHLNSRIPFYLLPEAMAAIPELMATARTSLRIRDIRACLQLKLWDPRSARMVRYSAARLS